MLNTPKLQELEDLQMAKIRECNEKYSELKGLVSYLQQRGLGNLPIPTSYWQVQKEYLVLIDHLNEINQQIHDLRDQEERREAALKRLEDLPAPESGVWAASDEA